MNKDLLTVQDLSVRVEEKNILKGLNLSVKPDEIHVLVRPNGAGKSTLGSVLMGNPRYEMTGGSVKFQGQNLLDLPANECAKTGIFMSFQNPLEVLDISLANFVRNTTEQRTGKRICPRDLREEIAKALEVLNTDPSHADRDLNVGLSGGEKEKAEILQLLMLKLNLVVLDKTNSDLDMDVVRTVSCDTEKYQKDKDPTLVIITYNTGILSSFKMDKAYVLVGGLIVADGDDSLVEEINHDSFTESENKE